MLLNYLKLSLRLMARNPFFTFINVIGLAVGLSTFYILWQYARYELKSDEYHKDADRMARIGLHFSWTDDGGKKWGHEMNGNEHAFIIPRIIEDFPEVEETLRILHQADFDTDMINHGDKVALTYKNERGDPVTFNEKHAIYSDPNLFRFFAIPLVHGNSSDALSKAGNVALSRSTAEKYFGKSDPTGKQLALNDSITLTITAVFEDLPHNSHLNFDVALSNVGLENKWNSCFRINSVDYIKLVTSDFKLFETKLNKKVPEYFEMLLKFVPNGKAELFVQPLTEIAFSPNYEGDQSFTPKSKLFLIILGAVAISVLLMAWINYVNLALNRMRLRYKEIATRKTNGASGVDLFRQFLIEALMINFIAGLLALTIIQLVRTPMSSLLAIYIYPLNEMDVTSAITLLAAFSIGILITTLYPFILSISFRPKTIFTMAVQRRNKLFLPIGLTTVQIGLAVVMIALGYLMSLQLNHILGLNTGINKDQVLVVEAPINKSKTFSSEIRTIKQSLGGIKSVKEITLSHGLFEVGRKFDNYTMVKRIGSDLPFGVDKNYVDEDFTSFYGIKLLAGRSFLMDEPGETLLISRIAAGRLGFSNPQDAINGQIEYGNSIEPWNRATVIGVFEDFRLGSFLKLQRTDADGGRGIVLKYNDTKTGRAERLALRIEMNNLRLSVEEIEKIYKQIFPAAPFVWYFLDDHVNAVYFNERASRNQVTTFTILAIGICCLGLIGIISNKATERTKEIGIRKILGANLLSITSLLLKTPAMQTLLATALGLPIAYYFADLYLQKFTERIVLHWWHFIMPVLILVTILFFTISSLLWKAAKRNPVDALKYQ